MSKYAYQFLADQVTEMLDTRWQRDVTLREHSQVEIDESCNGVNWGKGFTFGEQLLHYLILKYMETGQPSVGLLSLCQSLMRKAEKNGYRYTIWKDDKARFAEGVLNLHRSVDFSWIRPFGIAEGILQLENFNSNIRMTKDGDADDAAIKGAQITLNLCIECAAAHPASRSRPSVFCSQKCRISNHSRKQLKSLTADCEPDEVPLVHRELQITLLQKLQEYAVQGLNYLTVKDSEIRPGIDDLANHNKFGVDLPESRSNDLWSGTFDVKCYDAKQAIPIYNRNEDGLHNAQVRDLEEDLGLLYQDSPDAYWGQSGDKIRKKLKAIDPENSLVFPEVREVPTRSKKLVNEDPFLVKWRATDKNKLRRYFMTAYGSNKDPDKNVGVAFQFDKPIEAKQLLKRAFERDEKVAQRVLAADFPVIFTEPGSVEETIAALKAGTVDLSELGRFRDILEGWTRNDPRLPGHGVGRDPI